jgi:hypothetical protein
MNPQTRPAALIFGAPRSGTTSLWRYLSHHPDLAPSRVKELDFFKQEHPYTCYGGCFGTAGTMTLEASPVYFREHMDCVPRLAAGLPEARLVCILRDPAPRLRAYFRGECDWANRVAPGVRFADYARIVAGDLDPAPINPADPAAAAYVKAGAKVGIYADILEAYLAHFRPEQILVLFLDDMIADPAAVVSRTLAHFGLDPARMPAVDHHPENKGVEVRNQRLFRMARAVNNCLEPLFNQIPAAKAAMRSLHHAVNARPVSQREDGVQAALVNLRDFYSLHNTRFLHLLETTWEPAPVPAWLEVGRCTVGPKL